MRGTQHVRWHLPHLEFTEGPPEGHTQHDGVCLPLDRLVHDRVACFARLQQVPLNLEVLTFRRLLSLGEDFFAPLSFGRELGV